MTAPELASNITFFNRSGLPEGRQQLHPLCHFRVLVFALHSEARQLILPNRVRYPTDWSFASGCSPPHLTVTQLPSATELDGTLNRTFTCLISAHHRRTYADVHVGSGYGDIIIFFFNCRRDANRPCLRGRRHSTSAGTPKGQHSPISSV